MTFETFQRNMNFLKVWREKTNHTLWEWPDSRDPEVAELMLAERVVPQDLEKSMVALAAWRAADSSVYHHLSTIVHVIRNRQNKGMFRSHLTDANQFPAMAGENSPFDSAYPESADQDFVKLLELLDDILASKTVDLTQGAIWFGLVGGNDEWFNALIKNSDNERTVQVGWKTFYKPKEKK